ncbi:MAG TPA: His/Gly/Thr/Pro-type tRNA ligase C-terminal domain-containing protein, partial [Kiritimatiellia bacterium]|nr:His/Gly/Thr/Pro-type tRNA ligase C-terminal domain-containing protein [Kiritimatiellia bacterium]
YRIRIGDQDIEGVGFALGVERVIMALEGEGIRPEQFIEPAQVWLVSQGEAAFRENLLLAMTLRRRGISCQLDLTGRSMKAQMRMAGKSGAPQVIIRGDQEMEKGTFLLKDMKQGTQEEKDMPGLMLALSPVHPA